VITLPASAGISQPGVPGREFSRCTGFVAAEEAAGVVEDVPILHALETSATIAAVIARNIVFGTA